MTGNRPKNVEMNQYSKSLGQDNIKNRRQVLQALAAGTTGASMLHYGNKRVKAGSTDEISIIIGYHREERGNPSSNLKPVERNVPTDWYKELQAARDAQNELESRLGNLSDVAIIGAEAGEFGGKNAVVGVYVTSEQARGEFPESFNQIPVEVTVMEEGPTLDCSCTDLCDDAGPYIPGGNVMRGNAKRGSTFAMYDSNNNKRFATARHLFTGHVINRKADHPNSGDVVGKIVIDKCIDDWVVVKPLNSHTPQFTIAKANSYQTTGFYTKNGVDQIKANGDDVSKVGSETCKTSGPVHSSSATISHFGSCTPRDDQVTWGSQSDSQGGDSGAPVYHPSPIDSSNNWIISMDQWSTDSSGVGGTGAYAMYNDYGYTFA